MRILAILAALVGLAVGVGAFVAFGPLPLNDGHGAVAQLDPWVGEDITSHRPDFSGRVLHWISYSRTYALGSPDAGNGRQVIGDTWMEVNSSNEVIGLRGTFRYEDGSFRQDYLYTDLVEYIAYGASGLPPAPPDFKPSCPSVTKLDSKTFSRLVDPGEPSYLDENLASKVGYVAGSITPFKAQTVQNSLGNSHDTIDAGSSESWTRKLSSGDTVADDTVTVDPVSFRILSEDHIRTDGKGTVQSQFDVTFSPVEIYSPSDVPTGIFDPTAVGNHCNA